MGSYIELRTKNQNHLELKNIFPIHLILIVNLIILKIYEVIFTYTLVFLLFIYLLNFNSIRKYVLSVVNERGFLNKVYF